MRDRQKLGIEMVARWMTRRRGIDPDAKVYYRLHKDGTRSRIDERDPKEYDGVVSAWVWYGLYEATELVSVYNAAVTAGDDPVPETLTGIRQIVAGASHPFDWNLLEEITDNACIFSVLLAMYNVVRQAAHNDKDQRILGNIRAADMERALLGVFNEIVYMHRKGRDMSWGALVQHDEVERTVSVVRRAHYWMLDDELHVWGLTTGDNGYERTHICVSRKDLPAPPQHNK